MKSIHTLIPDIYHLVQQEGWQDALTCTLKHDPSRSRSSLRLSGLGPKCPRALWYSVHHPESAEALPPQAEIKYCYGHIIEQLVLQLARRAGHRVEGEQDELIVDGVKGHRDCVIDGCLADIKSMSTLGFKKLKNKTLAQDDPFGYLDQLDGYSLGSILDPLVTVKDKAYIIGVDKTLGHMILYEHECRRESIRKRIADYRRIISLTNPPMCECGTRAEGSSGNIGLDVRASYSPYKYKCFPHLRTFVYKERDGVKLVYLTKVVREPNVTEIRTDYFSSVLGIKSNDYSNDVEWRT